MTMINKMPKSLHTVVAPRYLTELEYGFTGTATGTEGDQGYFNIWANGIALPGTETSTGTSNFNPFTTTSGADAGVGGVIYPANVALTALQCVGETMLASLYDKFRVWKSSIEVIATPISGGTNAQIVLLPITGTELFTSIPGNDGQRAQSLPRSKFITVSPNNNIRQNRIASTCVPHVVLGLTRQQYLDDPGTAGVMSTSNPPSNLPDASSQVYWQINMMPFSSTGTVTCNVEVRVRYHVELFDPLGPTDT